MNRTVKQLLRVAGIAVGIGAAALALRHRLLPQPDIPEEPPPRFRTGVGTTEPPGPAAVGDDLTSVKGIGPAYSARLQTVGIASVAALARADAAEIASLIGVSEELVAGWIEQAATLS